MACLGGGRRRRGQSPRTTPCRGQEIGAEYLLFKRTLLKDLYLDLKNVLGHHSTELAVDGKKFWHAPGFTN